MKRNGELEKQLAIDEGRVDDNGVPVITVTADGGWGKRSYGHSYTSLSGMGCIIGVKTGLLLYLGMRNKFCYVCATNPGSEHTCYKNWDGSSTAMETNIIVAGFLASFEMHGVYYTKLVADGDSSVGVNVHEEMMAKYNVSVQKIQCVNHAISRLKSHMYDLLKQTRTYGLLARKLLKPKIERMGYYVKSAIIHNKNNTIEAEKNIVNLAADIRNVPFHTFGDHSRCRSYFCKPLAKGDINLVPDLAKDSMWAHLLTHFTRTAGMSDTLIYNLKNNGAESMISLVSKYSGGKRKNIYMKHQYNLRTMMAGNSHKEGGFSHYIVYKDYFKRNPNKFWETAYNSCKLKNLRNAARPRKNKNHFSDSNPKQTSADGNYGPNSHATDMNIELFQANVDEHMQKRKLSPDRIVEIEVLTRGQSANPKWHEERRTLITSTKVHQIVHKRADTKTVKIVEGILFSSGNWLNNPPSIQHGIDYEQEARKVFEDLNNVTVQLMGLVVESDGVIGASPDGSFVITESDNRITRGLLEIKCPYTAFSKKCSSILSAIDLGIIDYLQINDSKIELKKSHEYYTQIVVQLATTGFSFCDLFVYIPGNGVGSSSSHCTVRVYPNPELWVELKQELTRFFKECILPEIIDSKKKRSLPIRDIPFDVNKSLKDMLNGLKPKRKVKKPDLITPEDQNDQTPKMTS